jgi:hypothetical protein
MRIIELYRVGKSEDARHNTRSGIAPTDLGKANLF